MANRLALSWPSRRSFNPKPGVKPNAGPGGLAEGKRIRPCCAPVAKSPPYMWLPVLSQMIGAG
eukprot:13220971-Alexandrium_andersonii.AAC.1